MRKPPGPEARTLTVAVPPLKLAGRSGVSLDAARSSDRGHGSGKRILNGALGQLSLLSAPAVLLEPGKKYTQGMECLSKNQPLKMLQVVLQKTLPLGLNRTY